MPIKFGATSIATQTTIDTLALSCAAMWELLSEKLGVTEQELLAKIEEIDLRDGKLDGKIANVKQAMPRLWASQQCEACCAASIAERTCPARPSRPRSNGLRAAEVLGDPNRFHTTVAKSGCHGQRLGFRSVPNVADDDRRIECFDVVAEIGLTRVDDQQVIVGRRGPKDLSNAFVSERFDIRDWAPRRRETA